MLDIILHDLRTRFVAALLLASALVADVERDPVDAAEEGKRRR